MTTAEHGQGAVIVTGASRGIGAAIAEQLAEDGYGVVVNYAADADGAESVVSTIRGRGGRAVAVRRTWRHRATSRTCSNGRSRRWGR